MARTPRSTRSSRDARPDALGLVLACICVDRQCSESRVASTSACDRDDADGADRTHGILEIYTLVRAMRSYAHATYASGQSHHHHHRHQHIRICTRACAHAYTSQAPARTRAIVANTRTSASDSDQSDLVARSGLVLKRLPLCQPAADYRRVLKPVHAFFLFVFDLAHVEKFDGKDRASARSHATASERRSSWSSESEPSRCVL